MTLFPSILARYLSRDVLQTTLAVTLVLLLIFLCGRFSRYLVDAATGKISADIILTLLLYRAPSILERILPLGLFLGILLVFGRLYVESEISALQAAGVSQRRLLSASGWAIVPVALITGLLTLYVSPAGYQQVESMLSGEKKRSEMELVEAGKFLRLRGRGGVVYTGEISSDRQDIRNVFISRQHVDGRWTIIRAEGAVHRYDQRVDNRYLTLLNGTRYVFAPGQAESEQMQFAALESLIKPSNEYDVMQKQEENALSTATLLTDAHNPVYRATLQWRLSMIVLVPLVAVLAVAMSRTTPRQGRYIKLLPAMLMYFAYMTALDVVRHKMADGDWNLALGMWPIHALFALVAFALLFGDSIKSWRARR